LQTDLVATLVEGLYPYFEEAAKQKVQLSPSQQLKFNRKAARLERECGNQLVSLHGKMETDKNYQSLPLGDVA